MAQHLVDPGDPPFGRGLEIHPGQQRIRRHLAGKGDPVIGGKASRGIAKEIVAEQFDGRKLAAHVERRRLGPGLRQITQRGPIALFGLFAHMPERQLPGRQRAGDRIGVDVQNFAEFFERFVGEAQRQQLVADHADPAAHIILALSCGIALVAAVQHIMQQGVQPAFRRIGVGRQIELGVKAFPRVPAHRRAIAKVMHGRIHAQGGNIGIGFEIPVAVKLLG